MPEKESFGQSRNLSSSLQPLRISRKRKWHFCFSTGRHENRRITGIDV
ncbi:hypothetical protein RUMHYD_03565 [Blautia hydrogenotrophica DSM 10507]|uniref:Uncharacterized protein n=1 Tax=Blautia hydrogenotrophica (strain DSM 10507 / JCM 14656 / S5a33) TaxID=476272 RepID=C0CRQ1_BLAHS|nr:hypothetical protein RUMHYD_03565 [Blautia hydrogenotrophica DSM 10507]